ncbi:MAG: PLP-dependent transferase, partial [Leptospiraceae bacterium]|nr:PLP-dependent transferase [Leptospiraceae bacterium]
GQINASISVQSLKLPTQAFEADALPAFAGGLKTGQTDFKASQLSGFDRNRMLESTRPCLLYYPDDPVWMNRIRRFAQHSGFMLFSRVAEDFLLAHGQLGSIQEESYAIGAPPDRKQATTIDNNVAVDLSGMPADAAQRIAERYVRERVAAITGDPVQREHVSLTSCGMNAFYAAFRAIQELQKPRGRGIWLQLGWLYLDTIALLQTCTGAASNYRYFADVHNLEEMVAYIKQNGRQIAGAVVEMPTNPMLHCPALDRIAELAREYEFAIIADPSLATPYNVNVFPCADVMVNSLTKYAAAEGDVIMGTVVINPDSPFASRMHAHMNAHLSPPYARDVFRMAHEIRNYESVVTKINANAVALADWFQNQAGVSAVHSPLAAGQRENYTRLARRSDAPGGVLTIELNGDLARFYDRLPFAKGPSFGLDFTLVCPFMYLAHYDLVSTESGRQKLRSNGLNPDLVRISVGTEDFSELTAGFALGLKGL